MQAKYSFPVAREGFPFILLGGAVAAVGGLLHVASLIWLGCLWAICCLAFFRNPPRVIPQGPGLVVSPADGTVIGIGEAAEPNFLHRPMQKVSIFLSVLNVHVNRSPLAGTVVDTKYTPGKFHVASGPAASDDNERNAIFVRGAGGEEVVMVQVAGKIARRIICYVKAGDTVERGVHCGLIRFGSRVDIYLPTTCALTVGMGDCVRGGTTVIGRFARV